MPTWVDWAGGDTFWGVGMTGAASTWAVTLDG